MDLLQYNLLFICVHVYSPDEVVLRVDTFHARVMLYISAQGVRGYVTELSKGYVAKPIKYLDITTPIADFRVLRAVISHLVQPSFSATTNCSLIAAILR